MSGNGVAIRTKTQASGVCFGVVRGATALTTCARSSASGFIQATGNLYLGFRVVWLPPF